MFSVSAMFLGMVQRYTLKTRWMSAVLSRSMSFSWAPVYGLTQGIQSCGCLTMPSPPPPSLHHCTIAPRSPQTLWISLSLLLLYPSLSFSLSLLLSVVLNLLFFCCSPPATLLHPLLHPPALCLWKWAFVQASCFFLNTGEWHKTDDHKSTP